MPLHCNLCEKNCISLFINNSEEYDDLKLPLTHLHDFQHLNALIFSLLQVFSLYLTKKLGA